MNRLSVLIVLVLSLWLPMSAASAQAICAQLLRGGVFDKTDLDVDSTSYRKMAQWMCDNRNKSSGNSLGFQVTDIAKGLGFSGNSEQFDEWSSSFCESSDFESYYKLIDRSNFRIASELIINGFNSCINNSNPGVWITYSPGASPLEFVVRVGFNPVGGGVSTAQVAWQNAVNSGCPASELPLTLNAGSRKAIVCRRPDRLGRTILISSNVIALNDSVALNTIPNPPKCDRTRSFQGMSFDLPLSPCQQKITFRATGSFVGSCGNRQEVANVTIAGGGTSRILGTWSDTGFDSTAYQNGSTPLRGETFIEAGTKATLALNRITSTCSDPAGGVFLEATASEVADYPQFKW